jgi:hypothetical protein
MVCQQDGADYFTGRWNKTHRRQHECSGYQRRPRWILATRHRARRHPAHVVPAIHGRRSLRGSWLRLVMMMFGDVAKATQATVHAISQKRRTSHRRIQKRHRQQAKPCRGRSNAIFSFPAHKDQILPNDTPLRRFVEPSGSQPMAKGSISSRPCSLPFNCMRTAPPRAS